MNIDDGMEKLERVEEEQHGGRRIQGLAGQGGHQMIHSSEKDVSPGAPEEGRDTYRWR